MGQIKCPECGYEISDEVRKCPECGYEVSIKEQKFTEENGSCGKEKYAGIIMCILAVVLFIFSIKNITNEKYQFYVENYGTYMAEYEENLAMSQSYNNAILRSGYKNIASTYNNLANEAMESIWLYRIKAAALGSVGVVMIILGIKKIRR